ncbi:MAG TPA: DUF4350 domain-containing protein [Thermoanaerobaculia bacterium]|nr:DUF4350 domain-containing protein [Thermoanaerobaculia bacterium]
MPNLLLLLALLQTPAPPATSQVPPGVDTSFDTRVAEPAYRENGPRVLIDEAHHNVHTAGGGYKPFADLIASDGYRVEPGKTPFTGETLKGFDTLVIVNPRGASPSDPQTERAKPAFTEAEADAVRDWVREGGSLLLIADHYPIGSATQRLASRFGVEMSNGWTEDPGLRDPEIKDLVFTRENGGLADHPITQGIQCVGTFLGQSLKGPEGSVALLRLSAEAKDFLPPDKQQSTSAAGRAQGLALELGRGRVVVLGEAAMLTAQKLDDSRFGMNVPGLDNRQLALNVMRWLGPHPPAPSPAPPEHTRPGRGGDLPGWLE